MKYLKTIIAIGFTFVSLNAVAQLKNFPVLVCKDDSTITKYLDSLNTAKGNPNYTITKNTSNPRSEVFSETFAMDDQPYFTCYAIILKFLKLGPYNVCIKEDILCTNDYAAPNIEYINKNFTKAADSTTLEMISRQSPIVINATIDRKVDNICHIIYQVKDLN
jgi:hypothetical protein